MLLLANWKEPRKGGLVEDSDFLVHWVEESRSSGETDTKEAQIFHDQSTILSQYYFSLLNCIAHTSHRCVCSQRFFFPLLLLPWNLLLACRRDWRIFIFSSSSSFALGTWQLKNSLYCCCTLGIVFHIRFLLLATNNNKTLSSLSSSPSSCVVCRRHCSLGFPFIIPYHFLAPWWDQLMEVSPAIRSTEYSARLASFQWQLIDTDHW